MNSRAARRLGRLSVTVAAALSLLGAVWGYGLRLRPTAALSGWLLAATVVILALFGVRKTVRTIPLGRASTWLQIHLCTGLVSGALFVAHAWYKNDTGFAAPNGIFEVVLATLYLAVAGSGIAGLALTRLIPARLTVRGDELIFERLPIRRRELRERAEAIVVEAASQAEATTLADFYAKSLAPFFAGPRHFWAHVTQSRRPLHLLTSELQTLQRFLGEREKALAQELTALVEQKDAADHAQALQATLKVWLAAHVAVTGALLAFTLVHVIVVYAYGAA